MSSKLLASTLLAASLIAAPAVALAQTSAPQTQPAPKTMHHSMKSSHMNKGTTTGMSSSKSHKGNKATEQKPSSGY